MSTVRTHWREALVGATILVFVVLVVVAVIIRLHPVATTATPHSNKSPTPSERPVPSPVFTVAPPYPPDLALTPTQAVFGGKVVDSGTMAPLPGAELAIDQAGGPLRIHTDSLGVYRTAVETARPFSFTVVAAGHIGGGGFGRLCAGDRSDTTLAISPRGGAPAAPVIIQGSCKAQP